MSRHDLDEITPLRRYCNIFAQTQIQTAALNNYIETQSNVRPLSGILPPYKECPNLPPWMLVKELYKDGKLKALNYMVFSHYGRDGTAKFTLIAGDPKPPPLF